MRYGKFRPMGGKSLSRLASRVYLICDIYSLSAIYRRFVDCVIRAADGIFRYARGIGRASF